MDGVECANLDARPVVVRASRAAAVLRLQTNSNGYLGCGLMSTPTTSKPARGSPSPRRRHRRRGRAGAAYCSLDRTPLVHYSYRMESDERSDMHTFVTLTDKQRTNHAEKVDRWTETLIRQARNDDDPETQANARLLLDNRGISWRLSDEW